jgi:hypothetical protein
MPAGAHTSWPMPSPAELGDPQRAAIGYQRWKAHSIFNRRVQTKNELGQPVDYTCTADETHPARVQFVSVPGTPNDKLEIEPPRIENARCTGTVTERQTFSLPQTVLSLDIPRPARSGPLNGSKDATFDSLSVHITYKLNPSN